MLKISNINLPGNLVLSPMAGITDAPFREIARQNGADYTISEMVTSQLELWGTNKTKWRLQDQWQQSPRIIQIAGASPEVIVNAAIACEQIGADLLEINMGCPAKKVCNVLAGSALLKNEALVAQILKATCSAVSIPVILKTRIGFDHANKNIQTIARIAEDSGIKSLTIHGRTKSDLYNGIATHDLTAQIKQNISIPVFANGDITTPEEAYRVLKHTSADGLYLGRGTLGRPWLFRQIKDYLATGVYQTELSTLMVKPIILQHMRYIYQHYDEYMGVRMARKHIKWYWQNLFGNESYRTSFAKFSVLETSVEQLDFVENVL